MPLEPGLHKHAMIAPQLTTTVKGKVLVIDDESDIRESLELLLASEGYAVELAKNAAEGLRKMEVHPARFCWSTS